MSFLIAAPELVAAAATDLANIGSTITEANASAVAPTTGVLAAGADEVSAAIASLFSGHAEAFQTAERQGRGVPRAICPAIERGRGLLRTAPRPPTPSRPC